METIGSLEHIPRDAEVDAVVIGWDPSFDYVGATQALIYYDRTGKIFSTTDSTTYATPGGRRIPGPGSFHAFYRK
jgi:ribonucleotide monophosphatase NagD (HAD superfamily)